ncbi:hypothetical protein GQ53DRAFT_663929 [Thozetella sp. PMI_491]|nr:hypothetical protein GQ53DRAFT_663929 [Thozetella sp. PMI_491]
MASSVPDRTGSCLCGKIQVRLRGEPDSNCLCHCLSCQKGTGGIFTSLTLFHEDNVEFIDPQSVMRHYEDTSPDSGRTVERSFCGICGSNIRIKSKANEWISERILVPMGLLGGQKDDMKPVMECYVKRKVDWLPAVEQAGQFESMWQETFSSADQTAH